MLFELSKRLLSPVVKLLPAPSLEVTRQTIRIPALPAGVDGYLIAQLSDLHIGRGDWGPQHLEGAARAIREARPDVVVNTGDFLRRKPPLSRVESIVRRLLVPGVPQFAILGNHDFYAGEEELGALVQLLDSLGVTVLENRVVSRKFGGETIAFAGLQGNLHESAPALRELLETRRPRIVLLHEPDLAEHLPFGCADLVLAGHTHGGQVALSRLTPWIVRRFSGSRYVAGLYSIRGMPVYVNRGLGYTGLPFRFRAHPEVALIRLTR